MMYSDSQVNSGMAMSNAGARVYTPVALFVYNRPWHTKQTVGALLDNPEAKHTDLYVFADAAKSENEAQPVSVVRAYVRAITGFNSVTVVERNTNLGLSKSIIKGVTQVCRERGRAIVLEDDIVVSPHFLRYMNDGLDSYQDNEQVISVSGYVYPIQQELPETFFLRGADCWGWATWERAWELFESNGMILLKELEAGSLTREFDSNGTYPFTRMLKNQAKGKKDSWAIRWHATAFIKNKYTLYPRKTLVHNIGVDGSGENCTPTDAFYGGYAETPIKVSKVPIEELSWVRHQIMLFHRKVNPPLPLKIIQWLFRAISRVSR